MTNHPTAKLTPSGQHPATSYTHPKPRGTSSYGRSVGRHGQSRARSSRTHTAQAHGSHFGGGSHGGFGGFRGGGGFHGGGRHSDIRLKQDIVPLGRLANGIGIYRFRYKGNDHTAYVGVMAQEVQTIVPGAVSRDRDGYLRVDYGQLGLEFMTLERWMARSSTGSRTAR